MRGLLISFEGCDRSGKSTQCVMLSDKLKRMGQQVQVYEFPKRDLGTGKLLDAYLRGKEEIRHGKAVHLLFSANRWEFRNQIESDLEAGKIVVLDRYVDSGRVYSHANGLDWEWCCQSDKGLAKPDLVFFMDIDPASIEPRKGYGKERYEVFSFQEKVYQLYQKLSETDQSWIAIGANLDAEAISDRIMGIVEPRLNLDAPSLYFE